MKTLRVSCDKEGIKTAVKIIRQGGIVVFPTDTVYGIGCDPLKKKSVEKIYKIKDRNKFKAFPVLGFSKKEISKVAKFDKQSSKIADQFWPGKITLVLKLKDQRMGNSLHLEDKIAVRVPNNPCILEILKNCKLLVGTSANRSGGKSFNNPNECLKRIKGYDVFVDGVTLPHNKESTIIEFDRGELIIHRQGDLSKEEVLRRI